MTGKFHLYLYGPGGGAMATSFDEVAKRLEQLDRLYFEPDGSFGWAPSANESIFGMVYDAAGRVQYIELRGECELASWRKVTCAICDSRDEVMLVMCLQKRQLQEFQTFEETCWKPN